MGNMLIADTCFFISLFDLRDPLHVRAIMDITTVEEIGEKIQVNDFVIQELFTLHNIKYQQNSTLHYFASSFFNRRSHTAIYKQFRRRDISKIYDLIVRKEAKNLSFTDLSLIINLKEYKSGKLLSYDKALIKYAKNNGIKVFGDPD